MALDVPGKLGIIGPPADHIGMEGDDVNGIRSAAVSGYVVDEFLCCELVLEGHGNIQVVASHVLSGCEDERTHYSVGSLDEVLSVHLGSPLALGLGPQAVFFVVVDGGVVLKGGGNHEVEEVDIGGLVGEVRVNEAGGAVFVAM